MMTSHLEARRPAVQVHEEQRPGRPAASENREGQGRADEQELGQQPEHRKAAQRVDRGGSRRR